MRKAVLIATESFLISLTICILIGITDKSPSLGNLKILVILVATIRSFFKHLK